MKKQASLIGCLLFAVLAVSQQFFNGHEAPTARYLAPSDRVDWSAPPAPAPSLLVVDRNTWEVFDPEHPAADLSANNTPELKWERYKAVLAFEFPDEYRKQYPPAAEEPARFERGLRIIENPPTFEEALESLSPEVRESFDRSLEEMLHPKLEERTNE